ncbi:putative glucan 1,3-beta-glucosidase [Rosa chinensis]|uniref:Putative glucan 1,3-beta-glucosidase n=1 Tax=Rosa chinensis TaxID=74649 RepID=A0A2P6R1A7_ROSCH|nr:putative glucan 1,3-beta-glucosidase [Rosa chinensis]
MARILIFFMELVLLCLCIATMTTKAEAECMIYKERNQPLNTRINDLVSRMTLEEKIGQMTQIDRSIASPEVMYKYKIGSVLSGSGSVPAKKASAETWIRMVNDFQNGCLSTRLAIPLIYGIDAIHGHNNVYKATIFPHNIGLGATRQLPSNSQSTRDPELVKRIGAATALEVRATGIHYTFAPCVAVGRDPRWGRCYESYSEDPKLVQAMTEIIPGLQGEISANSRKGAPYVAGNDKVAACAKHYVGDGGTIMGLNENNTVIDRHGLLSIHMPPCSSAIIKGVATIMGISAGIDMVIMVPYNHTEFIKDLTFHVKNKIIPMSRIDDAVKRILRVKFTMGLFEKPLADLRLVNQLLGSQTSKILVAGSHADNLGYQCGGWTIEWQGLSGNNLTRGITILTAIRNTVAPETKVVYKENPDAKFVKSNNFSHAIVMVGEPPYAEGAGDNLNLTIPKSGRRVIRNVCGAAKCVVCLITGRPVVIKPYLSIIDTLVAAWLPGTEGQGVADVLFGDYGFNGKLPRTWFRTAHQLPMNVGDSHYDPLSSLLDMASLHNPPMPTRK